MSNKIIEFCKNCNKDQYKRFIKDGNGYYSCVVCLENHCKKHRKKNWEAYLAQKANSRKKEGSIKITKQDIQKINEKQLGLCKISGVPFDIESKWNRPSLDRIDNSKGYTPDNLQLVTWLINRSRGALTVQEFIDMCKTVANSKQ